MPWNGSGDFVRTDGTRTGATVWSQARDASVLVNAPDADTHDEDVGTGLENCLTRDGQNSPAANLPMNSKKHTAVADASLNNEYATYGQLLALTTPFVGATNVGGTATAITLAPSPAATSNTTGKGYSFFIETNNTGEVTVAVSSLAAVSMRRSDGSQFASGDLLVGRFLRMVFGGSHFISDVEPPAAVVSGGGGDITSVTATAPLTGGGSTGDVSIGLTLTASDIPNISARTKITERSTELESASLT